MSVQRALVRSLAVALASAGAVWSNLSPASAADLHFVVTPAKVVVNQSYENISWGIAGGDADWIESAEATLEHVATREEADFDYADPGASGVFKFYDWNRPGRYQVYGVAHDSEYNDMTVASAYVTVKFDARSNLTATRRGAYVTLRALTKRYDGGYPLWAAHRNATVMYQRYAAGAWHTIAKRTVPGSGATQVTVRKPAAARYRVVAVETARVWGDVSATVKR